MASKYMLKIVTPDKNFFEGEVEMVILRTLVGDIGIMNDHEPTVAPISIGEIRIKIDNEVKVATCSTGFVNIDEKKVTIVIDAAEWVEEIDVDRAKEAAKRAKQRLEEVKKEDDVERAKISLARAMNRVKVSENGIEHKDA